MRVTFLVLSLLLLSILTLTWPIQAKSNDDVPFTMVLARETPFKMRPRLVFDDDEPILGKPMKAGKRANETHEFKKIDAGKNKTASEKWEESEDPADSRFNNSMSKGEIADDQFRNDEDHPDDVVELVDAMPSNRREGLGGWATLGTGPKAKIYRPRSKWVYSYTMADSKPSKMIDDGDPVYYKRSKHKWPARITAVLQTPGKKPFYIFYRRKHCKRHFVVSHKDNSCPSGWKENSDLFGCNPKKHKKMSRNHKKLCNDTNIDSALYANNNYYFFRKAHYWKFDGKGKKETEFGSLLEFGKSKKVLPGYKVHNDGMFIWNKKIIMVYHRTFTAWDTKPFGKNPTYENPIEENVVTNKSSIVDDSEYRAIVKTGAFNYTAIIAEMVYYLHMENKGEIFHRLEVVNHLDTPEMYPPNVTSALDLSNDTVYFFRHSKYCKRPLDGRNNVTRIRPLEPQYCEWLEVSDLLACDKMMDRHEQMKSLCSELEIIGSVVYRGHILLFQQGQFWVFDARPTHETGAFGDLVAGEMWAQDRWIEYDPNNEGVYVIKGKLFIFKKKDSSPEIKKVKRKTTTFAPEPGETTELTTREPTTTIAPDESTEEISTTTSEELTTSKLRRLTISPDESTEDSTTSTTEEAMNEMNERTEKPPTTELSMNERIRKPTSSRKHSESIDYEPITTTKSADEETELTTEETTSEQTPEETTQEQTSDERKIPSHWKRKQKSGAGGKSEIKDDKVNRKFYTTTEPNTAEGVSPTSDERKIPLHRKNKSQSGGGGHFDEEMNDTRFKKKSSTTTQPIKGKTPKPTSDERKIPLHQKKKAEQGAGSDLTEETNDIRNKKKSPTTKKPSFTTEAIGSERTTPKSTSNEGKIPQYRMRKIEIPAGVGGGDSKEVPNDSRNKKAKPTRKPTQELDELKPEPLTTTESGTDETTPEESTNEQTTLDETTNTTTEEAESTTPEETTSEPSTPEEATQEPTSDDRTPLDWKRKPKTGGGRDSEPKMNDNRVNEKFSTTTEPNRAEGVTPQTGEEVTPETTAEPINRSETGESVTPETGEGVTSEMTTEPSNPSETSEEVTPGTDEGETPETTSDDKKIPLNWKKRVNYGDGGDTVEEYNDTLRHKKLPKRIGDEPSPILDKNCPIQIAAVEMMNNQDPRNARNRYAVVDGNQMSFIHFTPEDRVVLESQTIPVSQYDRFPTTQTAAVKIDDDYYFFRCRKFCKRQLNYESDPNEFEGQGTEDPSSKCVWWSNRELFGCNKTEEPLKEGHAKFCKHPVVTHVVVVMDKIYVWPGKKFYIFKYPEEGDNPKKNGFEYQEGPVDSRNRFNGVVFTPHVVLVGHKDRIYAINFEKNEVVKYNPDGTNIGKEELHQEDDYEPNSPETHKSVVITTVYSKVGSFARIQHDTFWRFIKSHDVDGNICWLWSRRGPMDCRLGDEIRENVPPGITGKIDGFANKTVYYFRDDKHCQTRHPLAAADECIKFLDNKNLFNCSSFSSYNGTLKKAMIDFCQNPVITGGFSTDDGKVYILRNVKYWVFNKNQDSFGRLIDFGNAKKTWQGWRPDHDGFFYHKNTFFMFKGNKWWSWTNDNQKDVVNRDMDCGELVPNDSVDPTGPRGPIGADGSPTYPIDPSANYEQGPSRDLRSPFRQQTMRRIGGHCF